MAGAWDPDRDVLLVGAFERHNFGDWLMAWCFERLMPGRKATWVNVMPVIPPTAPTPHRLESIHQVAVAGGVESVPVIHVGGETLQSDMDAALQVSLGLRDHGRGRIVPGTVTGLSRPLAYVTPARETILGREVAWGPRAFYGVGGLDPGAVPAGRLAEVAGELSGAAAVTVRDRFSHRALTGAGLSPALVPDIVSLYPELLGEPGAGVPVTPRGAPYALVQASDDTLARHGEALLDGIAAAAAGFDTVRVSVAGLAPLHDSFAGALWMVGGLRRRGCRAEPALESSPHRIAGLIGGASLVMATSLHYRIVAMACAVPRISLFVEKTRRYCEEWDVAPLFAAEPGGMPGEAARALAVPRDLLVARSREIAAAAREEVLRVLEGVGIP
jgi:hypothetical protein